MYKKLLVIILIILIGLTGCRKKLGDLDLSNIIRDINFDMTFEDIYEIEGKNPSSKKEKDDYVVIYYEDKLLDGYSGEVIYRFDEKDRLDFIKFKFDNEKDFKDYMKKFLEYYPNYERYDGLENTYKWDGYINDDYAALYANYDSNILEISKD